MTMDLLYIALGVGLLYVGGEALIRLIPLRPRTLVTIGLGIALAARLAGGGRVLDVFCHVGGFGLAALAQGASQVLAVDGSAPALDLAERGAAAMGVSGRFETRRDDAFEALVERIDGEPDDFRMLVDEVGYVPGEDLLLDLGGPAGWYLIGVIAVWRYSWAVQHFVRGLLYVRRVFPEVRARADALGDDGLTANFTVAADEGNLTADDEKQTVEEEYEIVEAELLS